MDENCKEQLRILATYLSHGHSLRVFANGDCYLIKDMGEKVVAQGDLLHRMISKLEKLK